MSPSSGDLKRAKRAVRRAALARRDALPADERSRRSRRIVERVAALPDLVGVARLLTYWPMGSEVDPRGIEELLGPEVALALPKVVGSMIVPIAFRVGDPLAATALGPREPAFGDAVPAEAIDAVLVPGVAFDRSGARVGYGGGFYDRFAASLRPGTPRIALAFALQIAESVPSGGTDVPVDLVVTEDEVIRP